MTSDAQLSGLHAALERAVGEGSVGRNRPLAALTTFKVGGPADLYFEPRSSDHLVAALRLAHAHGVAVTLLGGGSNVLVADSGVRGLVLRPRGGHIAREGDSRVRADAAVTINGLVRWLIGQGLAGLEAWAGTPGTVGGGVYGNAHWAGRLISDVVVAVRLAALDGTVVDAPSDAMEFGYDRSRLQRTREVLLSAVFEVSPGDPEQLRATARASLAYRKRTQPLASPSAGCIFQNPAPDAALPPGIPASAGALIDRAGLKGASQGGALVSRTHANFIVNDGTATAADVHALVGRCRKVVAETFAVTLKEEIVYLGDFGPEAGGDSVYAID